MRILVTGATGFVGVSLIQRLGKKHEIIAVSRSYYELKRLQKLFPHIEICRGNISNEEFVKNLFIKKIDVVYHLAALRALGIAERCVVECVKTNIVGTLNLLNSFNGSKFITISTDKAVEISSVYGASKFMIEKLIDNFRTIKPNINYYVIRSGNIFGSKDSVISIWKYLLLRNEELIVTDLNVTRYFCTVDQVIDFIFECIKKKSNNKPYYMKLKSSSVRMILKAMQEKYGKARSIKFIGRQINENKHEKLEASGISSNKAERYTLKELLNLI